MYSTPGQCLFLGFLQGGGQPSVVPHEPLDARELSRHLHPKVPPLARPRVSRAEGSAVGVRGERPRARTRRPPRRAPPWDSVGGVWGGRAPAGVAPNARADPPARQPGRHRTRNQSRVQTKLGGVVLRSFGLSEVGRFYHCQGCHQQGLHYQCTNVSPLSPRINIGDVRRTSPCPRRGRLHRCRQPPATYPELLPGAYAAYLDHINPEARSGGER